MSEAILIPAFQDMGFEWKKQGSAKGRLARVITASGAMRRTDYVFDSNGNRTKLLTRPLPDDPASAATAQNYTLAAGTNRLQGITGPGGSRSFIHDARGNMLTETRPGGVTVSAGYDGQGRLVSYSRSGEAGLAHVYNGLDDRVATTRGSSTRRFVYAPDGRVLGEYGNNASDVKAEFIWMSPQVGEAGMFGGDDVLGGYMPLAVAIPDSAAPDTTQLVWSTPILASVSVALKMAKGTHMLLAGLNASPL